MKKPKSKILTLKASELRPHPKAQRKRVPTHAKRIHENLDLDAIGVLAIVRYRIDGVLAYWIVDGQHRWWAIMEHGLGDWDVTCELHEDVKDDAAASALFLKLNAKATIAPFDLFKNEVEAGIDVAVGVKEIVEERGLKVDRYSQDGVVQCVATLKKVYKKDDGVALKLALDSALAAWGPTAVAVEGKLVEGLGSLFAIFNGNVDRPALVKKLAKFPGGAAGVLAQAKSRYAMREGGMAVCVQAVITGAYNRGRRSGKLSD